MLDGGPLLHSRLPQAERPGNAFSSIDADFDVDILASGSVLLENEGDLESVFKPYRGCCCSRLIVGDSHALPSTRLQDNPLSRSIVALHSRCIHLRLLHILRFRHDLLRRRILPTRLLHQPNELRLASSNTLLENLHQILELDTLHRNSSADFLQRRKRLGTLWTLSAAARRRATARAIRCALVRRRGWTSL